MSVWTHVVLRRLQSGCMAGVGNATKKGGKSKQQQLLDRAAVMKLAQVGWRPATIARTLALPPTFTYKWADRSQNSDRITDDPRSGRPRKATKRLTTKVVKMMEGKKNRSIRRVAAMLSDDGASVDKETVRRAAHAGELSPQKRTEKPLMKAGIRWRRRLFVREFRDTDWNVVAFADEASFQCFSLPNRKIDVIWMRVGEKREPSPTVSHSAKVHAYGVFSASGICAIHLFTERFTAKHYVDILDNCLLPAADDLDYHWIYLADRSPIHTAKIAQAWLERNVPQHVTPEQWPAHSRTSTPSRMHGHS
jgi:transposase